jgi:hypothetical protein
MTRSMAALVSPAPTTDCAVGHTTMTPSVVSGAKQSETVEGLTNPNTAAAMASSTRMSEVRTSVLRKLLASINSRAFLELAARTALMMTPRSSSENPCGSAGAAPLSCH